ncbi:MAG: acyl-CoA carboxylase subunit epsilon [Terracoccus sp.]
MTDQPDTPPSSSLIVSGHATPEEVAAIVVVLSALGGGDEPAPARRPSAWSDPAWRLVGPAATRGGWRRSGLPR